jgi:hypothetical protein
MAKKKQTPRSHYTKRKPILMPVEWHDLLHKMSAMHKQPMVWYLQGLMAQAADQQKISRPKLPWE